MSKSKRKRILLLSVVFLVIVAAIVTSILIYAHVTAEKDIIARENISKILEDAPKALGEKYVNLTLPDSISLSNVDKLQKVSIKWLYLMTKEETIDTISDLSATVNKDPISESDLMIHELSDDGEMGYEMRYYPKEEDYESPDDPNAYFCMVVDGYNFELTNFYWIQHICGFGTREKWYSADSSELADVVYKIDGQDYSAKQALDYANTVTEKYKDYYKEFDVVPKYVIASKNDFNDEYSYVVRYAFKYGGVEISDTGSYEPMNDRDYVFQDADLTVRVASPDKLMTIFSRMEGFDVNAEDITEDFVTLSSALSHTSKTLAENFMQEISDIDIVYLGKQELADYTQTVNVEDENGNVIGTTEETVKIDGDDTIDFIPMWRFKVKEISGDMSMPAYICIYVDMQTGEMIMLNDRTGVYISEKDIEEAKTKDYDIYSDVMRVD